MYRSSEEGRKAMHLIKALKNDGWEIRKIISKYGRTGIIAEHIKATNYDTGKKKKIYYVEGSGYEMGFLMGMLAEQEISAMAGEFADKVVFSFIGSKLLEKIRLIQEALIKILYSMSKGVYDSLPQEFKDEIQGMYDGCKSVNPATKVDMEHLVVLNVGIDVLCSMVYPGDFSLRGLMDLEPEDFNIPIMCNAFSVFGKSAAGGHYFCRDFMFSTADVFQDTAAMVIYSPESPEGKKAIPFVSMTAPGMAGCISAMNLNGAAIGVDMSASGNCSPDSIGINSLLLNRLCVQYGESAESMVGIIRSVPRGVSWNYIISDGENDRACVVEANSSKQTGRKNTDYPPSDFKPYLPGDEYLESHKSEELINGMMVRWNDYDYLYDYLTFNDGLWGAYNKKYSTNKVIGEEAFSETGAINQHQGDNNCPSVFYFAPQREASPEIILATNHFIIPEMRYYSMLPWTAQIVGNKANDIQWRYDALNRRIQETLDEEGQIDFEVAKKIISFISPDGAYPSYYSDNPKSKDGKQIRIEGACTVFDLKKRTAESHYGYYCDDWVKVSLRAYFLDDSV